MNLIQKLSLAVIASTAFTLSAQQNLIKYGDFENLPPANPKSIERMKKSGVDINRNPVALITGWYTKKGKVAINIVQATEKDKTAVKSGKNALNVKAANLHMYTPFLLAPGTYDLSFAYKGKGQVRVALYFYGAKGRHLGNSSAKATVRAGKDWQTYTGKITITPEKKGTEKARLVMIFVNADITVDDIVLKKSAK